MDPSRRRLLALALALAPAAGLAQGPRRATPPTLEALLAHFASTPGLHARFHEEKRLSVLAVPLVSDGTLDFAPPGRLVRRTTSPDVSVVLVDGRELRFGDARGQQRIDLDAQPVVRQFIDGFVAIVAGDRAALDRTYASEFRPGAGDAWELTLRPRSGPVQRAFRDIVLRGHGFLLERMTIRETNGDETATTFSEIDDARRYTPAEAARLFRLDGP